MSTQTQEEWDRLHGSQYDAEEKAQAEYRAMECDACGKFAPRNQIKSATAYGIEGDFCSECRGVEPEEEL